MNPLSRRISKLELRFIPPVNERDRVVARSIREARCLHLAAEGKELERERKRHREDYYDAHNRPLSIPEIIRNLRSRRFKEEGEREEMQMRRASIYLHKSEYLGLGAEGNTTAFFHSKGAARSL